MRVLVEVGADFVAVVETGIGQRCYVFGNFGVL